MSTSKFGLDFISGASSAPSSGSEESTVVHVQLHGDLFALEVLGEFEIRPLLLHLEPFDLCRLALIFLLCLDFLAEELCEIFCGLRRVAPLRRTTQIPRRG